MLQSSLLSSRGEEGVARSTITYEEANTGLLAIEQHAQEMEAMLIIAQRARADLLYRNQQLCEEHEALQKQRAVRRISSGGSSSFAGSTSDQNSGSATATASSDSTGVYDWVCEITKLSDVGSAGWRVCYSERFLVSMSDDERRYVLGTEPVPFAEQSLDGASSDEDEGTFGMGGLRPGGEACSGVGNGPPTVAGWDGAIVAVLGLFDKGKTFVLNRLTGTQSHCTGLDTNLDSMQHNTT